MEFALLVAGAFPPRSEMSSKEAFDFELKLCERASKNGFNGVTVNHHYLVGPDIQCFQPIPMCAHIMTRFPNLLVVTNSFCLSYHPPVEIAEQVMTLDMISPGKLILGVGQGYRQNEADAMGIAHGDRRDRLIEGIAAMKLLWREGAASYDGQKYKLRNADIGARPVNLKGPPILVAADTLKTVARIPSIGGDYWLPSPRHSTTFLREALLQYKQSLAAIGRAYRGTPVQRDLWVATDENTARSLASKSYEGLLHLQSRWGQPGERYDLPADHLTRDRVIIGNPQQCAEELISLNREFGAEFAILRIYTPGMDMNQALEMIDQVGQEVLPIVRQEVGINSLFSDLG